MSDAFPMRGDARRVQRANVMTTGGASPRYTSRFWRDIVPATAPALPPQERRLRYVPALYRRLSDKLLLALYLHRTPYVKHNRMVSV